MACYNEQKMPTVGLYKLQFYVCVSEMTWVGSTHGFGWLKVF